MKKCLLIALLFVSANIFAQDKREFFVKNNGDTVYCEIKKVDLYNFKTDKKIDKNNIWKSDSINCFEYNFVIWKSYPYYDFDYNTKSMVKNYIFLPDVKRNYYCELGNWGKVLGTKHNNTISATVSGNTVLYVISSNYNSGSSISDFSTLFIKNNELGLNKVFLQKSKIQTLIK